MADGTTGLLSEDGNDAGGDGNGPAVDPASISRGDSGAGSGARDTGRNRNGKRARKRRSDAGTTRGNRAGTASGPTTAKVALDIDGISALLVMIHRAVADRSNIRDPNGILVWEISPTEGDTLAKAASNVARHYDIAASQKMMDWGGMITVAMAVYLPRISDTVDARNRAMPRAQAA